MPQEVLVDLHKFGEIGEDLVIRDVQLLPIGTWSHPQGKISVTPERASSFAQQFQRRVAGQDLPLLYIHTGDENKANPRYGMAAGWFRDVRADQNKGVLADIELTEEAAKEIRERKWRYVSAELFDQVKLPHRSSLERDVLMGAALVNRPHLKGMDPILNEETGHMFLWEDDVRPDPTQGGGPMDPILRQLCKAAGIKLSEDQEALNEEQTAALSEYLDSQESKVTDLETKVDLLDKKLAEATGEDAGAKKLAEAGFAEEATLLLEYKADKAVQKYEDAAPEGHVLSPATKDLIRASIMEHSPDKFEEAVKLIVSGEGVVDLTEKGHEGAPETGGDNEAGVELNKLAQKIAKEEEISFGDALSEAAKQRPDLWNLHQKSMGSSEKTFMEVRS